MSRSNPHRSARRRKGVAVRIREARTRLLEGERPSGFDSPSLLEGGVPGEGEKERIFLLRGSASSSSRPGIRVMDPLRFCGVSCPEPADCVGFILAVRFPGTLF